MDPEGFRPRYHYTPPQNWMNDPNGLVYADGVYHLYYQHNPYGTEWGHMSWGHAVSPDLVRWEHRPIAIREAPEAGYTIFSGSAVVDHANTSGFGAGGVPPLVAVYTADYSACDPHLQDVHLAYSLDGGETFAQFEGNPVITIGARKFGDPKVFWHAPTEQWVMVNIRGLGQGHAVLYGSPNLRYWSPLSAFHAPEAAPGVWECPDLFPLAVDDDPADVRWVFKTNCVTFGGDHSGTRFFVGDFDGRTFTPEAQVGRALTSDAGAVYAEVTYNATPDGRRILVGWLRQKPHAARPWTGAQSAPRVLSLRRGAEGLALCAEPLPELRTLRGARQTVRDRVLAEPLALDGVDVSGGALEVKLVLDLGGVTAAALVLHLEGGADARITVDAATGELALTPPQGARIVTATRMPLAERPFTLRVLLDQALIEAFVEDRAALTGMLPYGVRYRGLEIVGGAVAPHLVRADVWALSGD